MNGSGWDFNFFTTKTQQRDTGDVTLATTTDSQADLDKAARRRFDREQHEARTEDAVTFTTVDRGVELQDGGTEHGAVRVTGGTRREPYPKENWPEMCPQLELADQAACDANYDVAYMNSQAFHPDYDDAIRQDDLEIPVEAAEIIRRYGLTEVPYFWAKHPQAINEMEGMSRREMQHHIVNLAKRIATDPTVGLDTSDYRSYRAIRNAQIRSRR